MKSALYVPVMFVWIIGNESLVTWSLFVYCYYENFQTYTKVWRAEGSPPPMYSSLCFPSRLFHMPSSYHGPCSTTLFFWRGEGLEYILKQIPNSTSFPAPQIPWFTHQR